MVSRATRRPTTWLVGSTSAIVSAGTRRRCREKKPPRTERASGTSGSVPYIGHSTLPTTRPRLSATRKPAVSTRLRGSADMVRTYSSSARKFPSRRKGCVSDGDDGRRGYSQDQLSEEESLKSVFRIW